MMKSQILRKELTANDIGQTGSHQSGIHVPMSMATFFPALSEGTLNPDAWIEVMTDAGEHRWRFIHYNSRVHGRGTRDEYRLTWTAAALHGCSVGDIVELECLADRRYRMRLIDRTAPDGGTLILASSGPWRLVRVN